MFDVTTTRRYTIRRCGSCALVFATPRPTEEELEAFYSSDYFSQGSGGGFGYDDYSALPEANAERSWRALAGHPVVERLHPRRVLDVGCASGALLAAARSSGWSTLGVELTASVAARAAERHGVEVVHGGLQDVGRERGPFGLITMFHVLEHVLDPAATLRRAAELLAPDGAIFVELPNWNSVGRTLKRARWAQMKPPEHINFFTPSTLRAALATAGLEAVDVHTSYPSLTDRAHGGRPRDAAAALVARAASWVGRGGYLQAVGRPR